MAPSPSGVEVLFDTLPAGSLGRRQLAAGELLFATGEVVERFFLVHAGAVRLVRHAADGTAVTLDVARVGEPVAEASLFAEHYHCDAVADASTVLGWCRKPVLLAHLAENGRAALLLLEHTAHELQQTRHRAQLLSRRSARERVMGYLSGLPSDEAGCVEIGRPWIAVASELGLTHEALYRTLAALAREGAIARVGSGRVQLGPNAAGTRSRPPASSRPAPGSG